MTTTSQNGIGATTGPTLATCKPLIHGGQVWFVNSTTGTDAVAPSGLDRTLPLATLQQAVTNSADGDIIVMLGTHAETISTAIAISKCLDIVGEGVSSGVPTATLTLGGTTSNMFSVTAFRSSIQGVKFAVPAASSTGSYIVFTPAASYAQFSLTDCYMPMNGLNAGYGLKIVDTSFVGLVDISGTTFISTATALALRPWPAVHGGVAAGSKLTIKNSTFDGGTVGFLTSGLSAALTGSWALYSGAAAASTWRITGTSFLRGADVGVYKNVIGYIGTTTASGSMRVVELY